MRLHENRKLYSDILRAASQHLSIKLEFIEKDYWITLVLSRLAQSKYFDEAVFKGGTSLSKGYNLIDRFSEDVDIAIINRGDESNNAIKNKIRTIESEITPDLAKLQIDGVTSKGSRFRKSVFEYVSIDKSNQNNKLIVEINSFANPFPYHRLTIKSFIFDFLMQTQNEDYIEKHDLKPFEVNVLNKEQTLLEKTVSLIRFSFEENAVASISRKIRHFYDLYYLMKDPECAEFVASASFKEQFDNILQHDRQLFAEPQSWQTKSTNESPLISGFDNIWAQLQSKYQTELSALAYRPIPNEDSVAKSFIELTKRIL